MSYLRLVIIFFALGIASISGVANALGIISLSATISSTTTTSPTTTTSLTTEVGLFDEKNDEGLFGHDDSSDSLFSLDSYGEDSVLEVSADIGISETNLVLNENILSAIPEPESYMMLLAGLLLVGLSINRSIKS